MVHILVLSDSFWSMNPADISDLLKTLEAEIQSVGARKFGDDSPSPASPSPSNQIEALVISNDSFSNQNRDLSAPQILGKNYIFKIQINIK